MSISVTEGVGSAVAAGPTPQRRPAGRRVRKRPNLAPYAFLAPFLLSFTVFFLIPSAYSVFLSFHKYRGYGTMQFVGLGNYAAVFSSPSVLQSAVNTLFYWLVPIVPLMALAFGLALAVHSKLVRWGRVFKPLLFIPQVMAPAAAALVWVVVLSDRGVVNSVLGLDIRWLSDPNYTKWSVALLLLWRSIGWYFVIFLAGLTSIPGELLEAAEVDGATAWQRVTRIIVPLMRPIFLFAIVVDTVSAIQRFTEPNLLLGSGSDAAASAPPSGAPLMNQVVQNITGGQFGIAAAVGWLMFVAIALISVLQFRLVGGKRT